MFLEEKRKAVRVFKDVDEALEWISVSKEEEKVLRQFVETAGTA
jgi:hypothetical protein